MVETENARWRQSRESYYKKKHTVNLAVHPWPAVAAAAAGGEAARALSLAVDRGETLAELTAKVAELLGAAVGVTGRLRRYEPPPAAAVAGGPGTAGPPLSAAGWPLAAAAGEGGGGGSDPASISLEALGLWPGPKLSVCFELAGPGGVFEPVPHALVPVPPPLTHTHTHTHTPPSRNLEPAHQPMLGGVLTLEFRGARRCG